ncbi:hypothetical protein HQ560_22125, partial [bacterium]|nr:hypothetical protein [bacterium]
MCPRGVLAVVFSLPPLLAFGVGLPTPSFEDGLKAPRGWRLEGAGRWEDAGHTGARSVSVAGTGEDSSFWRTAPLALEPRTPYRISFWARADRSTGGCVIAGPNFSNRDFQARPAWERHSFVFLTPDTIPEDAHVRFGQWRVAARVLFDDVRLSPVEPVHERQGDLELGQGEAVEGKRYTFRAPFHAEGPDYARPLHAVRCNFNSNRWTFGDDSAVVYRHALPGRKQTAASLDINCHYHVKGVGLVEASSDGKTWHPLARFDGVKRVQAAVPPDMLPADAVYVRLRSESGSFQIGEYAYEATLESDAGSLRGSTAFLDVERTTPETRVRILALPGGPKPHGAW